MLPLESLRGHPVGPVDLGSGQASILILELRYTDRWTPNKEALGEHVGKETIRRHE